VLAGIPLIFGLSFAAMGDSARLMLLLLAAVLQLSIESSFAW